MGLAVALVALFLVACGGGDSTTETATPAETTQGTTAAMTTETTTAGSSDSAAFDAAAAQVVEATNALLALRAECLAASDVGTCLTQRESEFAAGEATLSAALDEAGAAATAAGADPDFCQATLDTIAGRVNAERVGLAGRDANSIEDFSPMSGPLSNGNAAYFDTLRQQTTGDPGYVVGLGIGDCRLALASPDAPNGELLDKTLTFAFNSIRVQNEIGYGAWGVKLCLYFVSPSATIFCLQQIAPAGDFSELRANLAEYVEKLNAGFDGMAAAPGYAELSSTCKSAFEAARTDLDRNAAALEKVYGEVSEAELATSSSPSEETATAIYNDADAITEVTAATRTAPLDGTTMLMCLEEVAAQG
jgi:hypothetical protein